MVPPRVTEERGSAESAGCDEEGGDGREEEGGPVSLRELFARRPERCAGPVYTDIIAFAKLFLIEGRERRSSINNNGQIRELFSLHDLDISGQKIFLICLFGIVSLILPNGSRVIGMISEQVFFLGGSCTCT